jgi:hypothetical protein
VCAGSVVPTQDADRASRVRTSRLPPLTSTGSANASGAPATPVVGMALTLTKSLSARSQKWHDRSSQPSSQAGRQTEADTDGRQAQMGEDQDDGDEGPGREA